mgnify:CR=1 FL=1
MSFEQASHIASTWGLVFLAVCFGVAVTYALWPGNREKFKRAAQSPLEGENEDGRE